MANVGDRSTYNPAYTWNGSSWAIAPNQVSAPTGPSTALNPTASQVATASASMADPFASQRGQYQSQLSSLMGGLGSDQVSQDIQAARGMVGQPNQFMSQLQGLMSDPSKASMTAGGQFQMQQANAALERSQAAKGYLGSGNIMAELQKQSQGMAQADYGSQVQQLMSAAGLQSQMQGQQFNEQMGVAGASEGARKQQMDTLTTLSGANQGSPSAAGSLFAKQFDWSQQGQPTLSGSSSSGSGGGFSSGAGSGGYTSQVGNDPRYSRDQFGNLIQNTPEAVTAAAGAYRNWGLTGGLRAEVGGTLPAQLFNPSIANTQIQMGSK